MTLNLGGGVKNFDNSLDTPLTKSQLLTKLIEEIHPDLIGLQEVSSIPGRGWQDAQYVAPGTGRQPAGAPLLR